MNEALRELVVRAGAPEAMLNEIWFHIFCQKLVDEVITEMELEEKQNTHFANMNAYSTWDTAVVEFAPAFVN